MSIKKQLERLFIGKKEGKTLFEKMIGGQNEMQAARPEETLYNPLALAVNDLVELTFEEAGTYAVLKILIYSAHLKGKTYNSIKYFLRDPIVVEQTEPLLIECITSDQQAEPEQYLFHLINEFGYDEKFMELLEDELFVIAEQDENEEEVEKEYEKTFHLTLQVTTIEERNAVKSGNVETWNYELHNEMETSYLTIEMETGDGWFTMYEGRKLLSGEFEVYRLSNGTA